LVGVSNKFEFELVAVVVVDNVLMFKLLFAVLLFCVLPVKFPSGVGGLVGVAIGVVSKGY